VPNFAALSGLPQTSYNHKRRDLNNIGSRTNGGNQTGYNSADEEGVNYDPNMQILDRQYGVKQGIKL
jgi:hypothetical protein